jgi:hypothetical protein
MDLPFTQSEFFAVFTRYHLTVGVIPAIAAGVALIILLDAVGNIGQTSRLSNFLLASLWIWMGGVYHFVFFSRINPAAWFFGALFILQGIFFLREGVLHQQIRFSPGINGPASSWVGSLLVAYALVGYPILGLLFGHVYPASATFGLPCPTTIFTLGVMLWARRPFPLYLLVIPTIWVAIATSAAFQVGMWEDLGLLVSAIAMAALLFPSRKILAYES